MYAVKAQESEPLGVVVHLPHTRTFDLDQPSRGCKLCSRSSVSWFCEEALGYWNGVNATTNTLFQRLALTNLAEGNASVPTRDYETEFVFLVTNDGQVCVRNAYLLALHLCCLTCTRSAVLHERNVGGYANLQMQGNRLVGPGLGQRAPFLYLPEIDIVAGLLF